MQQRKDWVRLTKGQRRALRHRLRRVKTAAERRRLNAVALYNAGQKMEQIAETLGCSVASVSLDLQRWRTGRFAGLAPKPCGGSKPKVSEEQFAMLEQALEAPPCAVGYCAGTWTLPLMVRFLVEQVGAPKLHIGNVSRRLASKDWERLRPRLGIVRKDPHREAKLAAIAAAKRGRWQRTRKP
jgi:transposase